jgi:hypothetical protein
MTYVLVFQRNASSKVRESEYWTRDDGCSRHAVDTSSICGQFRTSGGSNRLPQNGEVSFFLLQNRMAFFTETPDKKPHAAVTLEKHVLRRFAVLLLWQTNWAA